MEPIFEIQDIMTYEVYKKMNISHTLSTKNLIILPLLILLVGGAVMYITESILYGLLVMVLYALILVLSFHRNVKKSWSKTKIEPRDTTYSFYEDHYEVNNDIAFNKVSYQELLKIKETDDLILLYVSLNQMHIIQKKKCSMELLGFLYEKQLLVNQKKK